MLTCIHGTSIYSNKANLVCCNFSMGHCFNIFFCPVSYHKAIKASRPSKSKTSQIKFWVLLFSEEFDLILFLHANVYPCNTELFFRTYLSPLILPSLTCPFFVSTLFYPLITASNLTFSSALHFSHNYTHTPFLFPYLNIYNSNNCDIHGKCLYQIMR